MAEDTKKQNEVTPEGTVEINEQDLDQAAGGALNFTSDQLKISSPLTTQTSKILGDGSVKPGTYDLSTSTTQKV